MVARRGLSTRFSGRRPSAGRTTPDERPTAGERAGRCPEARRAPERGFAPQGATPAWNQPNCPIGQSPERGDGQGVRGAAGGKTTGPQKEREGEPAGIFGQQRGNAGRADL